MCASFFDNKECRAHTTSEVDAANVSRVGDRQSATPLSLMDLDYQLPPECIATQPASPRDSARMLVMHRNSDVIEHRRVRDLPEYLHAGDALVFNNTAVIPARLLGVRADTGGKVEGLHIRSRHPAKPQFWTVMLKAGGKLKPGLRILLLDAKSQASSFALRLIERSTFETGAWEVELEGVKQGVQVDEVLHRVGLAPLPPYILRERTSRSIQIEDSQDRSWYQTVYADANRQASVAAPTAGLHFTPELLSRLNSAGVMRLYLTLHVGLATFKPVTAATLDQHVMHEEAFEIPQVTLDNLRKLRRNRGRVIAVGTTSVRALETLPALEAARRAAQQGCEICGGMTGMTDLMIAPPHEFAQVDGMITNFHLPRSTLLALVAAMVGLDRIKSVYRLAIENGYRFYSYGDAMLILP